MNPQTLTPSQPDVVPTPGNAQAKQPQPRRRFRWWWVLAVLALSAGVISWFSVARSGRESAAAATGKNRSAPAIPVVVTTAHRGNIGVYVTGLGTVTPLQTVTVRSRVDGQLMSVMFREGQLVHQGDLLAQIDPRPFEAQLTEAQGQLTRDQATLDNTRVDLGRYQGLWKEGVISEQQYVTQKALVGQYEGAVKADEGQIENAKLNITYAHIAAPITGRVGLRLVDPGNIVHATDTNGLMVITEIQPISVIFTISEDQLPAVLKRVQAGQRLPVDAYDREMKTKISQGVLSTLDNQIDQTTGTLKLRATYENQDGALFPNQFVNARLLVEEKRGVTLLPTAAIQRSPQGTFVYLVKDQTVTVRAVTTGTTNDDQTEIVSGITPGDVVVTMGMDKLQEGSHVRPSSADGSSPEKAQ